MQRPKPIVIAGIAAAILLLVLAAFLYARGRGGNQDRLPDEEPAAVEDQSPEGRCAAQSTYDTIKRELFRQAAEVRGNDQAAFDRIARFSSLRMDRPVLRSHDAGLGTVGCSGLLTLDLPPGVAVVGGSRSLSAEVGYILHPAGDGSGVVVMLEGADPVIVPLATLARVSANQPPPAIEDPLLNGVSPTDPALIDPTLVPPGGPAPEPEPTATADPSFDCRLAGTRAEIAVCNDDGLAVLDRQMAAQFAEALSDADSRQRRLLETTRNRFLRFRDRCGTNDCIAEVYQGRMREIGDIMAGRWRSPR